MPYKNRKRMYLSPVEFIAYNNPQGVAAWAGSMGISLPLDPQSIYLFFENQYKQNPNATLLKIKELHPHMQILKEQMGDKFEKPATKQVVIKLAGRNKRYTNFTETEGDDGYVQQATDLINAGYDEGVNAVQSIGANKDHTKEIVRLAAAFIAGAVWVKLFSK